ncbi:hypothetical protein JCM8202v2_005569 [Rhodotorula sphaerocarpa]
MSSPASAASSANSRSPPPMGKSTTNGEAQRNEHRTDGEDEEDSSNERSEQAEKPDETGKGGKSIRDKLPGMIKGPLDAFFPVFQPSVLYGAPPAFIVEGNDRSKWRARKIFIRTAIVFLGNMILMLEESSLRVLGNAAFFGLIVSAMLPPMFPVQLFLIVSGMLVLGMCLGWAWSCAAMAAALRARSQVLLAQQVQTARTSIASATNPASAYRRQIFEGAFLDWRSTVVFGFFLGIGAFVFGLLRAKRPKLLLLSIFGSIVLDVMTAYGPLFPVKNYTLATIFLIPTACYIAIALAATVLIFPQTLNHAWTADLVDKFLSPTRQRSDLYSKILETPPVTLDSPDLEAHPWTKLGQLWLSTQEAMSTGLEGLLGGIGLAELEVSMGQLSAKDLKTLVDPLRELHIRSLGLAGVWSTVWSRVHRHREDTRGDPTASHTSDDDDGEKPVKAEERGDGVRNGGGGSHLHLRRKMHAAEVRNNHDLGTLLALFEDVSRELRSANDGTLAGAMDWLIAQNTARWAWVWSKKARHAEESRLAELAGAVQRLEATVERFRHEHRLRLLEPFREFFDAETGRLLSQEERRKQAGDNGQHKLFAPGSLLTILSAADTLVVYSESVLAFARPLSDIAQSRRRSKIWFPTGLRKIGHLLAGHHRGSGSGPAVVPNGEDPEHVDSQEDEGDASSEEATLSSARERDGGPKGVPRKAKESKKKKKKKKGKKQNPFDALMQSPGRDPDVKPPRNGLQRIGVVGHAFLAWWTTPDVIFAVKYTAATVVLWLPQIFSTTAFLMYSEKLIWAQITAQTFMAPYAGDQIFSTWYIGAAKGEGTPVRNGAALFVFLLPLLAMRLHAPPAVAMIAIMATVTSILIGGYSWIDTHLSRVGNPGVGYRVAWRRALLVVIGAGVGLVFMILPPTNSSRRLVRRTHAKCLEQLGRVYAAVTSLWIEEQRREDRQAKPVELPNGEGCEDAPFGEAAQKAARARLFAIRNKLNSTKAANAVAGLELTLRGDWPKNEYFRLLRVQLGIMQALGQLGQALVRLDPVWRRQLVHETAFLNQPLVADITTTFTIISLALREGASLPAAMPGPLLDRLIHHDSRLRAFSQSLLDTDDPEGAEATKVEGARVGDFQLTFDILADERFGVYASAIEALSNILIDVDELEVAAKALLGEVAFPGFEYLGSRNQRGGV